MLKSPRPHPGDLGLAWCERAGEVESVSLLCPRVLCGMMAPHVPTALRRHMDRKSEGFPRAGQAVWQILWGPLASERARVRPSQPGRAANPGHSERSQGPGSPAPPSVSVPAGVEGTTGALCGPRPLALPQGHESTAPAPAVHPSPS